MFKKAERKRSYVKIALCGVSGSGKTYSALLMAQGLGEKIAMIDTENGSGELYSNLCEYDVAQLVPPFSPNKFISAIKEAEDAGYGVLIIDSLSHAWSGQGGILEMIDKKTAASRSGNSFVAWRDVTPEHNKLVDAILQCQMHVIVTMRSKTAYEMQNDEKGKKTPVKVGLAPIQREGMEYEFTIVFDIEREKHYALVSKDRTGLFKDTIDVITPATGELIQKWIDEGIEAPDPWVKFEEEKCFAKGKEGWMPVEEMSIDGLRFILSKRQYQNAHTAAKACLDEITAAEEAME